jgi:hypothetical protein
MEVPKLACNFPIMAMGTLRMTIDAEGSGSYT